MRIIMVCVLLAAVFCFGTQGMAESAQEPVKSASPVVSQTVTAAGGQVIDEDVPGDDTDPADTGETPLDDKTGAGTSDKLAAQGPVGHDDNTGLMNVVPSDSEGDIED